jgi:soluble lytic murein transglycosylase-like protein
MVCDRAGELSARCGELAGAIAEEARLVGLDPVLVLAIIEVESSWDPDAVSERDARGLMQLRRPTLEGEARRGRLPSADAHDPQVNVRAGIRYYGRLLRRFKDEDLALVAYNAGPNRLSGFLRAEEGVPERLWDYPQRIRREERRLRERLAKPVTVVAVTE